MKKFLILLFIPYFCFSQVEVRVSDGYVHDVFSLSKELEKYQISKSTEFPIDKIDSMTQVQERKDEDVRKKTFTALEVGLIFAGGLVGTSLGGGFLTLGVEMLSNKSPVYTLQKTGIAMAKAEFDRTVSAHILKDVFRKLSIECSDMFLEEFGRCMTEEVEEEATTKMLTPHVLNATEYSNEMNYILSTQPFRSTIQDIFVAREFEMFTQFQFRCRGILDELGPDVMEHLNEIGATHEISDMFYETSNHSFTRVYDYLFARGGNTDFAKIFYEMRNGPILLETEPDALWLSHRMAYPYNTEYQREVVATAMRADEHLNLIGKLGGQAYEDLKRVLFPGADEKYVLSQEGRNLKKAFFTGFWRTASWTAFPYVLGGTAGYFCQ